ncbi:MAG: sigma-70 family RNA polymerase sigma factor [Ferruginibacter sp.]
MTEKVFQETVFCYRDNMYRFAKNLLDTDAGAQDIVQSVMLSLWQQKDRLALMSNIKAYVMQAVKNECLNKMRSQAISQKHLAMAVAQQPVTEQPSRGNMTLIIGHFIRTLPQKQKMVMLLKDIEEFETHEIATLLDMDENAVRTNLTRARQKVRDYLQKIETYEQQQIQ